MVTSAYVTIGRWDSIGKELFRLSDQKKNVFCLGPVCNMYVYSFMLCNCGVCFPIISIERHMKK